MRLNELLELSGITTKKFKNQNSDIKGIAFDSSKVENGFLFIAIKGNLTDGHLYIEDAIKNGAILVIGEEELKLVDVPYFCVPNARKTLALLAKTFYSNSTVNKLIIGITGTNGKTTTSYMLKQILETQGIACALFGSISTVINGKESPSNQTTLDPLTYHQLLAASNDSVVIMEVSSHGLIQHRVEGIEFDYCIFTNLEQEHLDYHNNMEAYYLAKQSLFPHLKKGGIAVIHSNSEWGERLDTYVHSINRKVIKINGNNPTYSIKENKLMENTHNNPSSFPLVTTMEGKHNIENAALAFTTALSLGISAQQVMDGLEEFSGVPGRYQLSSHPTGATFVIDYAHTVNAFIYLLDTVKSHNPRKTIHVFGFRGSRDVQKRNKMLEVSLMYSNYCILTFDDLNGVSPEEMMRELQSLDYQDRCIIIPDRTDAIKYAWELAQNQDWIVITGKGNEQYQQGFAMNTNSDSETLKYLMDSSQKHSTHFSSSSSSK